MDVTQLPQSIQDTLNQNDSFAQSANNSRPEIPNTGLPPAPLAAPNPNAVSAPDIAPPTGTGTLADKISAAFLTHLASRQPPPPANSEAGRAVSAAQKVAGGVQNVMTNLGDAAAASEGRPGGWLAGVTRTLQSRNQRIQGEQDRAFQQDQERQKTAALVARNQVETLQIARNIQHADEAEQVASAARGKAYVDSMRANHDVEDNITQADLTSRVQKNPKYLESHYGRITGYEPVLDGEGKQRIDANGRPIVSPLWSLVDRQPLHPDEQHQVSQADHDEWLRNTGIDYPVGTKLTIDQFTALAGRSHGIADTEAAINKDRETALNDAQRAQLRTDLSDGNIQHYIAMVPGSALGGLYAASKNADAHIKAVQQQIQAAQQKGDQNAVQQLQSQLKNFQAESEKVSRVISGAFSDKDRDEYQKEVEREKHDRADEEEKRQAAADRAADKKAAQGKFQGDATLTGPAFLNSLQPDEAAVVKQIGTGQMPVTRLDFLAARNPALLSAVAQAYPDFDGSKVQGYTHTVKDFTSGPTSRALNAGGTALEALQSLYDDTTYLAKVPGTEDRAKREADLRVVSAEVAKVLNGGTAAPSEKEIENIYNTLNTTFNRRAAIKEVTARIKNKLDNYQATWDNAAPSKAYQAPMPGISPAGQRAAEYIANDGKIPQQPQQTAPKTSYKVGDTIIQNGHQYTVTSVDQSGKVTGAK
jgi:hypothetical protein